MKKGLLFAVIPASIIFIVGMFFLALLLVKFLWGWTIPDLFPGAVSQGLIAEEISWFTAFKVAIFVSMLSGMSASMSNDKD
ncbi:hypothetical protein RJG79_07910 [Mycoplasmatota bacterium WC44]